MRTTKDRQNGRWIRGLIIGILIAAVLTVVKDEYARFLLSHANYGMQALITGQKEGELDREEGVNLFIGSSMFRKGLDIDLLDEGLEGDNYILAYNGTRPFQCCEEIRYAVRKGVKIRHLYVDLYAYALNVEPWVEDSRLFLETDLSFKVELWKEMRAYSENRLKDFWELFVTANNERLLCWPVDYGLTNSMFRRGGYLSEDAGLSEEDCTDAESVVPDIEEVQINEAQVSYLRKLIALCREEGIPITFIETPKYRSVMYDAEYVALMRGYLGILNEEECPYYVVSDTALTCEDVLNQELLQGIVAVDTGKTSCYGDTVHLSGEGKREFTAALTGTMADSENGAQGKD